MYKWKYFFISIILLPFLGCGSSVDGNETSSTAGNSLEWEVLDSPQIELPHENTDNEGYIILFDGKTLKGWRGYNDNTIPENWCVDNGCLKNIEMMQSSKRGDLIFARKFKNFELSIEWKVSKGGESGIFYLVSEIKGQPITASSLKCLLRDDTYKKEGVNEEKSNNISCSLANLLPASQHNTNPTGCWNHTVIKVVDGVVVHYQNGIKVLEYTLWTPQWEELVSQSKDCEDKNPEMLALLSKCGGETHDGYIGLQDMGREVWFKNIKIKILA